MRNDLDELKENERQLDDLIEEMKERSKRQSESKQAYVTCKDLHNIDIYMDQMIMVVKAPPESQLILMDGDPPPLVLKSEKDEIDIFFCPDPGSDDMQPAVASVIDSDDEEASKSVRQHRKASSASANKVRNLGSAQRNLSKAFEEMIPDGKKGKAKASLFSAFNAAYREPSDDEDAGRFKSATITITKNDAMFLSDPSTDDIEPSSFGMKKDVKMTLFSPQKDLQAISYSEMLDISPNFPFSQSDSFFPLEPEAEYNFLLTESEGVMDLFDYNI